MPITIQHAIRTPKEYEDVLQRIATLMSYEDELEVLSILVAAYEEKHFLTDLPTAVAAIEFRMEQAGLSRKDLIPYLGSRSKVSEVLSGKRPLSLAMIRKLHKGLGIPAAALIQEPKARE